VPGTAGKAFRVRARAADGRDDEVSRLEAADGGPNLDDLGHRFVADYQIVLSRRLSAIFKRTDLLVGAAEADTESAESSGSDAPPGLELSTIR
jgi:hypothetical protein